jgi:ferritin
MFDFLDDLLDPTKSKSFENATPAMCAHVSRLQDILTKKYSLLLAYIHYGDQLRAFYRDGIYQHFQDHIKEERESIYKLNKKITALGADAHANPTPPAIIGLNDPRAVFKTLLSMELEVVAKWSELFRATTNDVALNALAQEGAFIDQQHADDMRRYLRSGC